MNNYLFNFAASYTGGGYKRLYAYLEWFDKNGGAHFIINSKISHLAERFNNNKYYFVNMSVLQRIFHDGNYLESIVKSNNQFILFYSYGVPLYKNFAKVNWFHLSKILPLVPNKIKMTLYDRLRFTYIGIKTIKGFKKADIISAESEYSLSLINPKYKSKLFLSKNGADDEIAFLRNYEPKKKEEIALVIGTYWYKAIDDSYEVFLMLREANPSLKLIIIGSDKTISEVVKKDNNVFIINKFLDRESIIKYLRSCKYYISTTLIENSYNAISEGVGFADESFISDIGPHREFLKGVKKEKIKLQNSDRFVYHVYRTDFDISILQSWEIVISEMLNKTNALISKSRRT